MEDLEDFKRRKVLKQDLFQSKAEALVGLGCAAKLLNQVAEEVMNGELTRSPLEILMEVAEELKPLERFLEDELRSPDITHT